MWKWHRWSRRNETQPWAIHIISAPVIRASFSQLSITVDPHEIAHLNSLSLSPISLLSLSLSLLSPLSLRQTKGKRLPPLKADMLRARNMKRYINQLTVARSSARSGSGFSGGQTMSSRRTEPRMKGTVHRANGYRKKLQSQKHPYLSQYEIKIIELFSASCSWHNEMLSMWF